MSASVKGARSTICATALQLSLGWVAGVAIVAAGMPARAAVELKLIAKGLDRPVYVTHGGDGSHRLFILEQAGRIRVLRPAAPAPTTFLDITGRVLSGGERGLLGLAFHPQFRVNGRLFVNYTRRPDGATVIAEYRVSPASPDVADPSERLLLTVAQPFPNHNGGMLDFGPDGFLYIGLGDGGAAFDPGNRAQDPGDLLGKILRIDVNAPAGSQPYSSPPTNPFAGSHSGRDEIYALGFRNPWRFSFDRASGQLVVGDVGQNEVEEIDVVVAGGNYGWRVFEGTHCTGISPGECPATAFIPPIAEYGHAENRCSVTGGYVYRAGGSSLPDGGYLFGDYCSGEIFLLADGVWTVLARTNLRISSFGIDEEGEIYAVDHGGAVYWVTAPTFLRLGLNHKVFGVGDTVVIAATLANRDPQVADVFFGVVPPSTLDPTLGCPERDAIVLFAEGFTRVSVACASTFPRNFAPLARNLHLPGELPPTHLPNLFSFTWTPGLPAGTYTFFAAITTPGAVADGVVGSEELIAFAVNSVSLGP